MRTFINISEVSKYGLQLSEYQTRELEGLRKEFAPFALVCKVLEIAYTSEYDNEQHLEGVGVILDYKGCLLRAYKCYYTDKVYRFCLVNPYRHKHTKNYRNENEHPNKIGKPTTPKMDAWLDYLLNEEEEKKAYAQKYIDQETAFRAELAELGDTVKWYDNGNQGDIRMNNLVFSFSIEPCHIGRTVKVDSNYNLGLSGFLQMADNKYQPATRQ